MDCSLPGSSVHGIFQARVLEWSAKMDIDSALNNSLGFAFVSLEYASGHGEVYFAQFSLQI